MELFFSVKLLFLLSYVQAHPTSHELSVQQAQDLVGGDCYWKGVGGKYALEMDCPSDISIKEQGLSDYSSPNAPSPDAKVGDKRLTDIRCCISSACQYHETYNPKGSFYCMNTYKSSLCFGGLRSDTPSDGPKRGTGMFVSDLCPGEKDIQCCVEDDPRNGIADTPVPIPNTALTTDQVLDRLIRLKLNVDPLTLYTPNNAPSKFAELDSQSPVVQIENSKGDDPIRDVTFAAGDISNSDYGTGVNMKKM